MAGPSYTSSQKNAINNYLKKHVRIGITITPEQRKLYKEHAAHKNISLTRLICQLLDEDIKRSANDNV